MSSETQLLALLLADGTRTPGLDGWWHQQCGSWWAVLQAGPEPLVQVLGEPSRARTEALFQLVERWLAPRALPDPIDGPIALAGAVRPLLASEAVEGFWVACLDARARLLGFSCVARGTLTACLVHPREVFAPALRCRAASIVVLHNHPSGDPAPSDEDWALTKRLEAAGELLGIPLLDHVVVAHSGVHSLGAKSLSEARVS